MSEWKSFTYVSSCTLVVSIDCGSFISGDVGINEAGWGWFVIYIYIYVVILSRHLALHCDRAEGEESKGKMKAQQKEGVNRVMYGRLQCPYDISINL